MPNLLHRFGNMLERNVRRTKIYMAKDRRLIHVIGLKRSGNYALINWLKPQMPGKLHHMNNIQPYVHPLLKDRKVFEQRPTGASYPSHWFICSYEDRKLSGFRFRNNAQYILLLRDPFNMIASRMKRKEPGFGGEVHPDRRKRILGMWCAYADRLIAQDQGFVYVLYDRWKDDREYRQALASQLGVRFSDEGLNTVSQHGGGSSFDGRSKDGKGSEMKTNDRWRQFEDNDAYWSMLNRPRLLELAHQLWPEHPAWPAVQEKLGWQPN